MAKWRASCDSNELTFEQLETSFEPNIGHENEEQIQRLNDSNDLQSNGITRHRISGGQRAHNSSNCLQRNRSHHSSGHYCSHQSHHQFHYCLHSNHNHIHYRNSHSNHFNQEMASNEELVSQASHPSHGLQQQLNYTLDQTEFERIWRQFESNKDRFRFLQSLYRSSGNLVFSEISFGSLGDIASALSEFDQSVDDFVFVVYILNSLSRAKRFLLSLQFLTLEERVETKKLFVKLWKNMNDIRQDLAENDITELTINSLMKAYEIDIE